MAKDTVIFRTTVKEAQQINVFRSYKEEIRKVGLEAMKTGRKQTQSNRKQRRGLSALKGELGGIVTQWASIGAAIAGAQRAAEKFYAFRRERADRITSTSQARRRLAQVATSGQDYDQMLARAESIANREPGVDLGEAYRATFAFRSASAKRGVRHSPQDLATFASTARLGESPSEMIKAVQKLRGQTRHKGTARDMLSMLTATSATTQEDISSIATSVLKPAQFQQALGGSIPELLAMHAAAVEGAASAEEGSTQFRALVSQFSKKGVVRSFRQAGFKGNSIMDMAEWLSSQNLGDAQLQKLLDVRGFAGFRSMLQQREFIAATQRAIEMAPGRDVYGRKVGIAEASELNVAQRRRERAQRKGETAPGLAELDYETTTDVVARGIRGEAADSELRGMAAGIYQEARGSSLVRAAWNLQKLNPLNAAMSRLSEMGHDAALRVFVTNGGSTTGTGDVHAEGGP